MLNFSLLIFEIIIIASMIIFMHGMRKQLGYGVLYVFVGALQFFQTLLVSSVYDNTFLGFKFSPGSTIFYTSSLFVIFLTFYSENIIKTRGLIYGLVISNVAITLFSHFLLVHSEADVNSSSVFLEELLDFELSLFLIGTSLLYIEGMLIVILFQFLQLKLPKLNLFLKILLTMGIVCLFDSVFFYTFFYLNSENYQEQMFGNIVGKQLTVLIFSFLFYFYLSHLAELKVRKPKSIREILRIFTF